jgi:hypothetical protein
MQEIWLYGVIKKNWGIWGEEKQKFECWKKKWIFW